MCIYNNQKHNYCVYVIVDILVLARHMNSHNDKKFRVEIKIECHKNIQFVTLQIKNETDENDQKNSILDAQKFHIKVFAQILHKVKIIC